MRLPTAGTKALQFALHQYALEGLFDGGRVSKAVRRNPIKRSSNSTANAPGIAIAALQPMPLAAPSGMKLPDSSKPEAQSHRESNNFTE